MGRVYTYTEARQALAAILEKASRDGEVRVKRRDGRVFVIRPDVNRQSPLDVRGLDLGLSADEIVQFVREGRRAYGGRE
jgi:hypothetical protein